MAWLTSNTRGWCGAGGAGLPETNLRKPDQGLLIRALFFGIFGEHPPVGTLSPRDATYHSDY